MTIYVDQAGLDFIEMLLPLPQVLALKACAWSLLPVNGNGLEGLLYLP